MEINPQDARLLAEQLARLGDRIEARFTQLETLLDHQQTLNDEQHAALAREQAVLLSQLQDHEVRLRDGLSTVSQFKLLIGLASGSSGLASLAALWKAFGG
jgi:hypothetical protein